MDKIQFCAPCLFGLEGLVSTELKFMDAQQVSADNGRVYFSGDYNTLARTNIGSRYAERILIVMGRFKAYSFDDLFEGVKRLPWENWIGKTDKFPVKGWSVNSKLHSVPDCQSIVKKAVVERLKAKYHVNWLEETGKLYQIQFSILKDEAVVMIDTSGIGLHKRGYRPQANEAPIKETLAAAIAYIAHVRGFSTVIDPMCGSGTLLIESAMHAMRIAPGLQRTFTCEKWDNIPREVWKDERERAIGRIIKDNQFQAIGYDIDPICEKLVMSNAKRAGVASRISFEQRDIKNFAPCQDSIIMCNPPYGERLLDIRQAEQLYQAMGKVLSRSNGNSIYIISPHDRFEEIFGVKADKRRKLYNGMIKCQLYMYFDKNKR